tara:strand:- start:434 stop:1102 length:669 start_codon:yes stop_codon:yes gene_type:complete
MRDPYGNRKSLEFGFRSKRFSHVARLIHATLAEKGSCRILDVGGTETYWKIGAELIAGHNVRIDLLNLQSVETSGPAFTSLVGDACDLSHIADNSYDLCHSNSVIEHVGDWADMKRAANEISRIAPRYFVQVPYFWFPLEPHFRAPFFHWLPEQLRYRLLLRMNLGFHRRSANVDDAMRAIQSAKLLDRAQLASLFPEAEIAVERVALFIKSLMAIRDAGRD